MKQSKFNKTIVELCGDDIYAEYNFLKQFRKNIFSEEGWKLFRSNFDNSSIEDGVYLTIRCGYSGIYQMINIWDSKNQKWTTEVADGSSTIMYKDIEGYLGNERKETKEV